MYIRDKKCQDIDVYLAPIFSVDNQKNIELGRIFYALIDMGCNPLMVASYISSLKGEWKYTRTNLFIAGTEFLYKVYNAKGKKRAELKKKFRAKLKELSYQKTLKRITETYKALGMDTGFFRSVIIDDKFYYLPMYYRSYKNIKDIEEEIFNYIPCITKTELKKNYVK